MEKKKKNSERLVPLIVLGFVVLISLFMFNNSKARQKDAKYYEIIKHYQLGEIKESVLEFSSGTLEYVLKSNPFVKHRYRVPNLKIFIDAVDSIVREQSNGDLTDSVNIINYVRGQDLSWIFTIVPSILGLLLMFGLLVVAIKFPGGAGIGRFGQLSKNKKLKQNMDNLKRVTFSQVAGAQEEKDELVEVIDFLKNLILILQLI